MQHLLELDFQQSRSLDFTLMMFEPRFRVRYISVIIYANQQDVPFVMLQPLIIPLAFDLGQGRLDILIIFQLDKKRRDVWIFRRGQVPVLST